MVNLLWSQHSRSNNLSFCTWLSIFRPNFFKSINSVLSTNDLAEDYMLSIKPWCFFKCDKELRTVGVWTCICRWEKHRLGVMELKVFIIELPTIYWFSSLSIDISSLSHKTRNDTMEDGIFVGKNFSFLSFCFVSLAYLSKIFSSLWNDIPKETKNNAFLFTTFNLNIKVALFGDLSQRLGAIMLLKHFLYHWLDILIFICLCNTQKI